MSAYANFRSDMLLFRSNHRPTDQETAAIGKAACHPHREAPGEAPDKPGGRKGK